MNIERTKQQPARTHDCVIKCRSHIDVTGVSEVISFDESAVILITVCGEMTVEGSGLRVGTLDTDKGLVSVDGKISSLYYSDDSPRKRRGLFGKAHD